jgi:TetR/AcrR family transcriptional regulator, regulator of cefoperazone and chloramphenicol sensitivity
MTAADDIQKRLLEAAAQVFAEKGFRGATVRDILKRAGVANIAAINYYFRDKERLYIETVKSACSCQQEVLQTLQWPAGTPPVTKLRDFIAAVVRTMLADGNAPWVRQLVLRELAQPTVACAAFVNEHIRPMAETLAGILQELLPGVPRRKRNLIAFSIVGQCFYHRVAAPIVAQLVGEEEQRGYGPDVLAEHITQFSLAALGLAPPAGSAESAARTPSDRTDN